MINTVSCTPDEARELIKGLRSLKLSFMLWGATGVGKSESVRQLAAELDAELADCPRSITSGNKPFSTRPRFSRSALTEKPWFCFSTKSRSRRMTRAARF
jgi:hypothetical protein